MRPLLATPAPGAVAPGASGPGRPPGGSSGPVPPPRGPPPGPGWMVVVAGSRRAPPGWVRGAPPLWALCPVGLLPACTFPPPARLPVVSFIQSPLPLPPVGLSPAPPAPPPPLGAPGCARLVGGLAPCSGRPAALLCLDGWARGACGQEGGRCSP